MWLAFRPLVSYCRPSFLSQDRLVPSGSSWDGSLSAFLYFSLAWLPQFIGVFSGVLANGFLSFRRKGGHARLPRWVARLRGGLGPRTLYLLRRYVRRSSVSPEASGPGLLYYTYMYLYMYLLHALSTHYTAYLLQTSIIVCSLW